MTLQHYQMLHKINIMSQFLILTLSKQKILSSYWKFCFLEKSMFTLISQSNFASLSPIQCYYWTVFWGASCFNAHLNYFVFVNKQNMPRTRTKIKTFFLVLLITEPQVCGNVRHSSLTPYCVVHAALNLICTLGWPLSLLRVVVTTIYHHAQFEHILVFCFVAGSLYIIAHLEVTT